MKFHAAQAGEAVLKGATPSPNPARICAAPQTRRAPGALWSLRGPQQALADAHEEPTGESVTSPATVAALAQQFGGSSAQKKNDQVRLLFDGARLLSSNFQHSNLRTWLPASLCRQSFPLFEVAKRAAHQRRGESEARM